MLKENSRFASKSVLDVDVYAANIPDEIALKPLYPTERMQEIGSCKNERVKKQKYCVWKLLGYALQRSYGLRLEELSFQKEKCGKWTAEGCFFSLSHCDGIAVVALSRQKVGVDVEKIADKMTKLKEKFLTEKELAQWETQEDKLGYLAEKWTQKESVFKMQGGSVFSPKTIEAGEYNTHTAWLQGAKDCVLSVAAEGSVEIKLHFDFVDLN